MSLGEKLLQLRKKTGLSQEDVTDIERIVDEIDWTSAWSKKYPILASYQGMKGINAYSEKISELYDTCKKEFGFSDADTALVLKDILYQKYKTTKKKTGRING